MKSFMTWVVAFVLVSLLAPQAFAQRGAVQGTVTDEAGEPIEDVKVRVLGGGMGREFKLKTNKKGKFFHGGIPMGNVYRVICEKEGYRPEFEDGVRSSRMGGAVMGGSVSGSGTRGQMKAQGLVNFVLKKSVSQTIEGVGLSAEAASNVNQGLQAYNEGNYQQAVDLFRQALQESPESAALWSNLGQAYSRLKRHDQAIEAVEKAIALKPGNTRLYRTLADIHANKGDAQAAMETFEKAAGMATSPREAAQSYYNMGASLINLGKNTEAVEAFEKAIEANPGHAEARYQLGIVLLGLNRIREATDALKEYIKISPTGPNAPTAAALVEELEK